MGTFIAGGYDTTGYTLSTTLVLLAQHPEIATKVQTAQSQLGPGEISDYLRCVIKESRRLVPVAATGGSRQFADPEVQLGSYDIPAGAVLLLPHLLSHRNKNVFGPDVDVFRPERWLEATDEMNESLF